MTVRRGTWWIDDAGVVVRAGPVALGTVTFAERDSAGLVAWTVPIHTFTERFRPLHPTEE